MKIRARHHPVATARATGESNTENTSGGAVAHEHADEQGAAR